MQTVSIIMAMTQEIDGVVKQLKKSGFKAEKNNSFIKDNLTVNLFKCGVMFRKKKILTKKLDRLKKSDKVIFTGIAGGVNPSLKLGDIVVPDKIRLLENDDKIIENSDIFLQELSDCANTYNFAFKKSKNHATTDKLVDHKTKKSLTDIDTIDMEAYHLIEWLKINNLDTTFFKIISDDSSAKLPSEQILIQFIMSPYKALVKNFHRHPIQYLRAVQLVRNCKKAIDILSKYLTQWLIFEANKTSLKEN